MRVVIVSFRTAHHVTTETTMRLQTLAEMLRDADHDVHVVCARFWPDDRDSYTRESITYHGLAPDRDTPRPFRYKLPMTLRRLKPDVIHVNPDPAGVVRAAGWATTLSRTPVVLEWTGGADAANGTGAGRTLRRADGVIVPSQLVRTWVRELGVAGNDVTAIPDPIDYEWIGSTPPGEGADIVYARHLDEAANLESLFLALAELRSREWTTTVIGDGPHREGYEAMARDLRIDDRVEFVGETDRDRRIAIYRASHVFAQTAEYCLFPTELAWALACGCVGVVEYHVHSSGHELVEGHDRGIRTTSETELTDAIVRAGRMDHRDIDRSFARFDREAVLDAYLETYEELQSSSGLFG